MADQGTAYEDRERDVIVELSKITSPSGRSFFPDTQAQAELAAQLRAEWAELDPGAPPVE